MAKAFKFELQDVLDFRNYKKEQAENELAKALAVKTRINNDLQNIAAQFVDLKARIDTYTDFEDIAAGNQRKLFLDSQKEELLKELAQAQIVIDEKRTILAEVMKQTTALEKLKEKEKAAYNEQLDAEEAAFIDDLASSGKHYHQ